MRGDHIGRDTRRESRWQGGRTDVGMCTHDRHPLAALGEYWLQDRDTRRATLLTHPEIEGIVLETAKHGAIDSCLRLEKLLAVAWERRSESVDCGGIVAYCVRRPMFSKQRHGRHECLTMNASGKSKFGAAFESAITDRKLLENLFRFMTR